MVVHWLDSLLGVPSAAAIAALTRPYRGHEAFICGPDPYLALVREALGPLGVARIHVERFLSLADNPMITDEGASALQKLKPRALDLSDTKVTGEKLGGFGHRERQLSGADLRQRSARP